MSGPKEAASLLRDLAKKIKIPPFRTFDVWYDEGGQVVKETVVAHVVQYEPPEIVVFVDYEMDATLGITTRVHHLFLHVFKVEETMRVKPTERLIRH